MLCRRTYTLHSLFCSLYVDGTLYNKTSYRTLLATRHKMTSSGGVEIVIAPHVATHCFYAGNDGRGTTLYLCQHYTIGIIVALRDSCA